MKFFIDSAKIEEIREAQSLGILDGVTTNPSLVAKEGRNFRELLDEILGVVDGPVSAEVISTNAADILVEARELAAIHPNIVVKVPLIIEGLKAVRTLSDEGIRTNVTLCFSAPQALLAAKAGATYISPFIGRLDDIGQDGMELIRDIVTIYSNYGYPTQVLAASIRHPVHVLQAALAGADVATVPFKIIRQMFQHPLTASGLDQFLKDWNTNRDQVS